MRNKLLFVALSAFVATFSPQALAQQTIGSFSVTTDKDPFGDGDTVVAMAVTNQGVFALRCIQSILSIGLATRSEVTAGDEFSVKIRADSKTIFDVKGNALGGKVIEVGEDVDKIFDEVSGAKTVSVRITGDASITYTVPVRQSAAVVALVKKACAPK